MSIRACSVIVAVAVVLLVATVHEAQAKFEFEDAARKIDLEKYKGVPNPPVYEAPLGACEVPNLSFSRLRTELKKRMVFCTQCSTKEDFRVALREAITKFAPVMSDEDYVRFLEYEATPEGAEELRLLKEKEAAELAASHSDEL